MKLPTDIHEASGDLFAIAELLVLCPVTDISATVASMDRYEILHDGRYGSRTSLFFSLFGNGAPGGAQIRNFGPKFWPFDREYLENGKSQRYMSIRA